MQLTDIPSKFNIPFASSAAAPYIRSIPQTPTGTPGQAALTTGFPPENFNPVAGGGVPPFGSDFNGLLNQVTGWNRWQATGRSFPPYDPTFQTAVGGYPRGSIVESLIQVNLFYYSIVDNNVTNPDTGGAGWIVFWRQLLSNTDLYVDGSTGNDANSGLSPATAKKTIGSAITAAWTFAPNPQFGITIHLSNGPFNESVLTPVNSASSVTIDGGNAATMLVNAGNAGNCFTVQGPNTMTVKNLTVQTSGAALAGFVAFGGATMITTNTRSNALSGSVFSASSGGNIQCGAHTLTGNVASLFSAINGGTVNVGNVAFTFANALSVSAATAMSLLCGIVNMQISPPASFVNPGNVTGVRYSASANGVIYQAGLGATFFPGTSGGVTATGGQAIT